MSIAELLNFQPWTDLKVNSISTYRRYFSNGALIKDSSSTFFIDTGLTVTIDVQILFNCSALVFCGSTVANNSGAVLPTSAEITALFTAEELARIPSFNVELQILPNTTGVRFINPSGVLNNFPTSDYLSWTSTTVSLPAATYRTLVYTYSPPRGLWMVSGLN